jgi:hypothetical protein
MKILLLLTVLFIGLKLTGYIDWNWFFVVLPAIIDFLLYFIIKFFRLDMTQEEKDAEDVKLIIEALRRQNLK